jgi:carboxymethylenebutenolidase
MPDGWNQFDTGGNDAMTCEVTKIKGHNGDTINAYFAKPSGNGPFPGIVLTHHMPGWDEFYRETARRFAQHGYLTICPDLYFRAGTGSPDDIAAKVRNDGGVADDQVVGDLAGGLNFLKSQSNCSGKVGIIGTCSGGRHSYLTACRTPGFSAVADLWGGGVVMAPDQLTPKRPVAPIDYTKDLSIPLLGLFGNDDQGPSPDQVNRHEEELKKLGKNYEFHRYDGAGHGFFYYHAQNYRQQQAMDGWGKVFAFFEKNLK